MHRNQGSHTLEWLLPRVSSLGLGRSLLSCENARSRQWSSEYAAVADLYSHLCVYIAITISDHDHESILTSFHWRANLHNTGTFCIRSKRSFEQHRYILYAFRDSLVYDFCSCRTKLYLILSQLNREISPLWRRGREISFFDFGKAVSFFYCYYQLSFTWNSSQLITPLCLLS